MVEAARTPKPAAALRAKIKTLAARATGTIWREVRDTVQHCDRAAALVEFEKLTPTLHSRQDGRYKRFFVNGADAALWVRPMLSSARFNTRPKTPPPAPVSAGQPKITRAPSVTYDPRYQIDPATRVLGGFATMGVGRYLEDGE